MKKDAFVAAMQALGWEMDRYGHLQKDVTQSVKATGQKLTRRMRLKLQATSCRLEVKSQTKNSNGAYEWFRIGGEFYSKIVQLDDGRVKIGSAILGKAAK